MIDSIELTSYGKFRGRRFPLGPFTVVYGPNEAGKTTLFDALFEAACAPAPRRGQVWTRLSSRYGEERLFKTEGEVPAFEDAVEFLELFAIRAGQVSIDAENGGSWTEAAKSSLYSHGFNPAQVAEKLEKRASTSNATKHQKNLNRLNSALEDLRVKITELRAREAVVLQSKARLIKLEEEIGGLGEKRAGLEAGLSGERETLEKHKLDRAAAEALRDRDFVSEVVQDEGILKGLACCRAAEVKGYDELQLKIAESERVLNETGAALSAARETLQRLDSERTYYEDALNAARREAAAAAELLPEAGRIISRRGGLFGELPPNTRYGVWAAGAVLALLGLLIARRTALGYLLVLAGPAAAFWLDRQLFRPKDPAAVLAREKAELEALFARWTALGLARDRVERATAEELQEVLMYFKAMPASYEAALANNSNDTLAAQQAIGQLEKQNLALATEKDSVAGSAAAWLGAAGCADRDEYMAKAGQFEALEQSLAKRAARLKELLELEKSSSSGALLALLDSRVKDLEARGARPRPDADRDLAAQESKIRGLEDSGRALEDGVNAKKLERENLAASLEGALARLPEELNELRVKEAETEKEIAASELQRAGAEWAARIYRELEADSAGKFAVLADDVKKRLAGILPLSDLGIAALDLGGVSIRDFGGELRALENLSSGTRDCFMLAARLTLALSARGAGPGLLLLDDPFASFDVQRRAAALTMIRDFQDETGWQIILFTKDAALRASLEQDSRVAVCALE